MIIYIFWRLIKKKILFCLLSNDSEILEENNILANKKKDADQKTNKANWVMVCTAVCLRTPISMRSMEYLHFT